jgi:hypothetical protein
MDLINNIEELFITMFQLIGLVALACAIFIPSAILVLLTAKFVAFIEKKIK